MAGSPKITPRLIIAAGKRYRLRNGAKVYVLRKQKIYFQSDARPGERLFRERWFGRLVGQTSGEKISWDDDGAYGWPAATHPLDIMRRCR
jgi:hypothetical protein